jgi:Protein of unknown function (DUF1592)
LASRLSFFLWSSIPDDELLAVAGSSANLPSLEEPGPALAGRSALAAFGEELWRPMAVLAQTSRQKIKLLGKNGPWSSPPWSVARRLPAKLDQAGLAVARRRYYDTSNTLSRYQAV